MGTMSKRSFMAIDPLVEDPEFEHDAVVAEQLEQALLVSIQQQASEGSIPQRILLALWNLFPQNQLELAEAVEKANKEAQERQASTVDAAAPEAQPGLAMPGMGAEAKAMPAPPGGGGGLGELLGAL